MRSFNILDKELDIHQHYLLEASAGTGKTFSIENIVVRLLVEGENPPSLEEILVVTFTRAATRDLKVRIRRNIESALESLSGTTPEYIQKIQGRDQAKRRLEQALFCFDKAPIFTIHSFCSRMLGDYVFEGDVSLDVQGGEQLLSQQETIKVVRDFLRTEIKPEIYSQEQLKLVLKAYDHSMEKLEKALISTITKRLQIEKVPDFSEQVILFKLAMRDHSLSGKKIMEDFVAQAHAYKGLCDRKRQIKPDVLEKVQAFADMCDQDDWTSDDLNMIIRDQLFLTKALDPSQRTSKDTIPDSLHYPNLVALLNDHLGPFVNVHAIFARMAYYCQQMWRTYLDAEEKFGFDDILYAMQKALDNPAFVQKIRSRYKAAIIDEFQDTDPIQWEIFQKLFPLEKSNPWGHLYLVGDPKQSIYAFRQADIYTYLSAAGLFEEKSRASLDTNYRSQPSLVSALNLLFSKEVSPGLIALPRLGKALEYQKVKSSPYIQEQAFSDGKRSVHFCIAEDEKKLVVDKLEAAFYFPFFVQEVQRLHIDDGMHFHQFAILVSDRYQAERASAYFNEWGIPTTTQRSSSLVDSSALPALRELLKAILFPKNESALKTALVGRIIGWDHNRLVISDFQYERVLLQFYSLRQTWIEEGFARFFQGLLQSCWHGEESVVERLLSQRSGEAFYSDLLQLVEILLERQSIFRDSPESLLKFLDDLPLQDEEKLKRRLDTTRDAVQILTLHSSKGLEFDVVFLLGTVKRTQPPSQLVTVESRLAVAQGKEDPLYQKYAKEIDAEKMRQLYVGMTRAKYRLYICIARILNDKTPDVGCGSPMELFLAKKDLDALLKEHQQMLSFTALNQETFHLSRINALTTPQLFEPKQIFVPGKPLFIQSFSSLAVEKAKPRANAPHDFSVLEKTFQTLPSGSQTGNLLHEILEKVPFNQEDMKNWVRPYVEGTEFSEWEETICQMVRCACKAALPGGFCLADVDPKKCYRETEFLYPQHNGFLKGIIDLVFEYQGKYYILDWKTNWLEKYDQNSLREAMLEHDYFLQAKIYKEAFQRYLNIFKQKDFAFGGVFYLFLRGLDKGGVYHCDSL